MLYLIRLQLADSLARQRRSYHLYGHRMDSPDRIGGYNRMGYCPSRPADCQTRFVGMTVMIVMGIMMLLVLAIGYTCAPGTAV